MVQASGITSAAMRTHAVWRCLQGSATCLTVSDKVLALATSSGTVHLLDYEGNQVKYWDRCLLCDPGTSLQALEMQTSACQVGAYQRQVACASTTSLLLWQCSCPSSR